MILRDYMTILVINNKGQYNHRIQRSLQYLKIPSQLVSNQLSIEEIESKEPIGLILGGGPQLMMLEMLQNSSSTLIFLFLAFV